MCQRLKSGMSYKFGMLKCCCYICNNTVQAQLTLFLNRIIKNVCGLAFDAVFKVIDECFCSGVPQGSLPGPYEMCDNSDTVIRNCLSNDMS